MHNHLIAAALVTSALTPVAATMPGVVAAAAGTVAGSGPTLYVDNQISGTVTPISTVTNTPGGSINAGRGPTNMEITPDGKTVYVVDSFARFATVTPISTVTKTPGKPIRIPGGVCLRRGHHARREDTLCRQRQHTGCGDTDLDRHQQAR